MEVFEHTWKEARRIVKRGLEVTHSCDTRRVLFKGLSHVAHTRSPWSWEGLPIEFLRTGSFQAPRRLSLRLPPHSFR